MSLPWSSKLSPFIIRNRLVLNSYLIQYNLPPGHEFFLAHGDKERKDAARIDREFERKIDKGRMKNHLKVTSWEREKKRNICPRHRRLVLAVATISIVISIITIRVEMTVRCSSVSASPANHSGPAPPPANGLRPPRDARSVCHSLSAAPNRRNEISNQRFGAIHLTDGKKKEKKNSGRMPFA